MAVDVGWCWQIGVDRQCLPYRSFASKHSLFEEGAFCLMVSLFFLESAMTINQQSFLVSNMCGEFMVCGGRRVWSINLLNRAVCSEESRVMFIEGVPTTALWDLCCKAIKKEMELSIAAPLIDIYIQEASPFCVASPLQVRMELATEIVLCFS